MAQDACPICKKSDNVVGYGKYHYGKNPSIRRSKCKSCKITFLIDTKATDGKKRVRQPKNKKGNIFDVSKESLKAMHEYINRGAFEDDGQSKGLIYRRRTLPKRPFNLYDKDYKDTKNGGHSIRSIIKEMLCNKNFMESLKYKVMLEDCRFWFNMIKCHKRFIKNIIKNKTAKATLARILKDIPKSDWKELEGLYEGKGEERERNQHLRALRAMFKYSKNIKPNLNNLQPINDSVYRKNK